MEKDKNNEKNNSQERGNLSDRKKSNNSSNGVVVNKSSMRETATLELPSFEGSEVVMYKDLVFKESRNIESIQDGFEKGVLALEYLVKDWNLVDEEGNKLPITEDSFDMLPSKDVSFLMKKVASFLEEVEIEEKKF
ncbi:MAG: hypothetical protein ACOCTT_01560 [archaeon]